MAGILLVAVSLFIIRLGFSRPPSEAQMVARFQSHKSTFEQLRLMLQRDNELQFVSSNSLGTMNGRGSTSQVSSQQLSKYRALMQEVGLNGIVRITSRGGYFRFEVFGGGSTDTS